MLSRIATQGNPTLLSFRDFQPPGIQPLLYLTIRYKWVMLCFMSREKEFDVDEVLGRAMELFWCHGYEATSLSALLEHLGIGKGSFYNTFGSKHELYLRALDRYRSLMGDLLVAELGESGPVKPAIKSLLEAISEQDLGDAERRGCMVVNAATELIPHDPEAERRVVSNFVRLQDALRATISRGQSTERSLQRRTLQPWPASL